MCYHNHMQNSEQILQFELIKNQIKENAKTVRGKQYCDELTSIDDSNKHHIELNLLQEMLEINQYNGYFPIAFSENALPLIEYAKKGGILSIRDLDMIGEDILTAGSVKRFMNKIDAKYVLIHQTCHKFNDLSNLEKEIHRVITKSQTIDDKASPELYQIRKEILKCERQLTSLITSVALTYKNYLSDENVTLRDGHFVIPVKTTYKSKVGGIIHDVSDSGYTTFIEPSEVVEINNHIVSLKAQENEEIRKILKMLTNLCLIQEDEIINNNIILANLDFIQAKAIYACQIDAIVAQESKDGSMKLKSARHPLLAKDKVIPNSFYFINEKKIVIISGPNAGGKTVALKTVGLLSYMHKCALAVPCIEATIPLFNHIFVDIGDSQSIEDNLSTFSAHITHIGEILKAVKSHDLVLIDELGTGTDPSEGEAIAIAVIKKLETSRCIALVSSHFSRLKEYAFTSKNIDNASMLFDEDNLKPTYIYKQGVPGQSYALDVAGRYGLSLDVINEAKKHLDNIKSSDIHSLMNELHKAALDNELKQQELNKAIATLDKEKRSFEAEKQLLKEKREKLLVDVEKEKEEILEKTFNQINDIMKKLNNPDLKLHEVIEIKKQVQDIIKNPEPMDYNEKIEVGCYVSVPSLNINGKVMRINANKALINTDSGMSFNIDLKKLHLIDEPPVRKALKTNVDQKIRSSVGLEINVIGQRVDEALRNVEKYLDDCRIRNLKQVRLIHGLGSGALKNAIAQYLKKCDFVASYRSGNEYEGGLGATIVNLK